MTFFSQKLILPRNATSYLAILYYFFFFSFSSTLLLLLASCLPSPLRLRRRCCLLPLPPSSPPPPHRRHRRHHRHYHYHHRHGHHCRVRRKVAELLGCGVSVSCQAPRTVSPPRLRVKVDARRANERAHGASICQTAVCLQRIKTSCQSHCASESRLPFEPSLPSFHLYIVPCIFSSFLSRMINAIPFVF